MWEEMFHSCPCVVTHLCRESWKWNYFRICYFRRWRKCYVCPNIGDSIDLLCNQQIYNTCKIDMKMAIEDEYLHAVLLSASCLITPFLE
jgi:hypothetical protein